LKLPRASAEHIEKLQKIKRDHKVALLLCVGGWERSAGFAMLSASAAGREKFAAAAVKFCRDSDFDGVDIDWEHPGSPQEYAAFAALLTALKKAFAPHRLQLTIAVAGWQELPAEAISAVDRVHLMAYDAEGRHSTYEFAESDVARMLKQNIPAGKLCLGVPFYGRGIADRSRVLTYAEIVSKHKPDPAVDDLDGIYFNGVKTIERKTKFARKAKLAGVMAWEIGQDTVDDSSLLKAIDRAAK
jgi:GH18 family chitinase